MVTTIISKKDTTSDDADPNHVDKEATCSDDVKRTVSSSRTISDILRKLDGIIVPAIQRYKYENNPPIKDDHGSGIIVR